MYKIYVDGSDCTFLPICSCGWRGDISRSRSYAWKNARTHEMSCHIGGTQAAHALDNNTRRVASKKRGKVATR